METRWPTNTITCQKDLRYTRAEFTVCELIEHTDWDRIVTRDVYEVLFNWEEKCMRRSISKGTVRTLRGTYISVSLWETQCLYNSAWCKTLKSCVGKPWSIYALYLTWNNCNKWHLRCMNTSNNGFNMNGFNTWSDAMALEYARNPKPAIQNNA